MGTLGIELEAQRRPFDSFEIMGIYSHNEGEFESFVSGTFWDTWVFHTLMPDSADLADFRTVRPQRLPLALHPEDRAFQALTKDFGIGQDELYLRGEWFYASDQLTDGDVDPFTRASSLDKFNLRAGYRLTEWNAEVIAWVRNLTDERWYGDSFDAPIQLYRMNSYPEAPRTWGVTFRKRWD